MANNNELEEALNIIDKELKNKGLSRRDALKVAGLGSASFLMGASEVQASTPVKASDAKAKILIIGGGLAGISTAARLTNTLSNPDITIIEPNPKSVSYQPGNTLVAAGIYTKDDIMYDTKDFIPNGVKVIQDKAIEFDPDNNKVKTEKGDTYSYDYMIVAAGLKLDLGRIQGLEEIGETTTLGDASKILSKLENTGVCTIYSTDGAVATWKEMQKFVEAAKSGKKVKGVFTHPDTSIKCGGAPKKIMYLTNSRLVEANARENAELTFYPKWWNNVWGKRVS